MNHQRTVKRPRAPHQQPNTQVQTHWLGKQADLERHFGRNEYRSWIEPLIPDHDDGDTLVLAAPSRFHADWVHTNFRHQLGTLTGRQAKLIPTEYAKVRRHEARKIREREHHHDPPADPSQQ